MVGVRKHESKLEPGHRSIGGKPVDSGPGKHGRQAFHLGQWLVYPEHNLIQSARQSRAIEPRLMEVLVCLCEQAPAVVHPDTLIEACWPGQFISDNPLHKCIAQLRKALDDDARAPRYIKTVPRKGYAVVADIHALAGGKFPGERPAWSRGSPYRGLEPYGQADRTVFFGRRSSTAQLIGRLGLARQSGFSFVLMMGPHSAGKTSLIHAGLLPHLADDPDRETLFTDVACWVVPKQQAAFVPISISAAFDRWRSGLDSSTASNGPVSVGVSERALSDPTPAPPRHELIVVDQLERVFDSEGVDDAAAAEFFNRLAELAQSGPVVVLGVMRNESYGRAMRNPAFRAIKQQAEILDLAEPDAYELHEIITGPARAAGLSFQFDEPIGKPLDQVMLGDAVASGGSLPAISDALHYLYLNRVEGSVLSSRVYRETGGIHGILANRAEQAMTGLSPPARDALPGLLQALVGFERHDRTRLVRKQAVVEELGPEQRELARALDRAGLLAVQYGEQTTRIELIHDSLLDQWPPVREWAAKNKALLLTLEQLRTESARWAAAGRKPSLLTRDHATLAVFRRLPTLSGQNLASPEREYIDRCTRALARRGRLQTVFGGLLASLLAVSLYMTVQYRSLNHELDNSNQQSEALIAFMLSDLKENLEPLARLDLLDMVARQVFEHYSGKPIVPDSESSLLHKVKALNVVGQVQLGRGQLVDARSSFDQGARLLQQWHGSQWRLPETRLVATQLPYWIGLTLYQSGDLEQAGRHWSSYLERARGYAAGEPGNSLWQLEESYALNNLGTLAQRGGKLTEAARYFDQSARIKRRLVAGEPDASLYIAELADTLSWKASVLRPMGDLAQALEASRESLRLSLRLTELEPENWNWWHRLGLAHFRQALEHYDSGVVERAHDHIRDALPIYARLYEREADHQVRLHEFVNSLLLESRILRHLGNASDAAVSLARARSLLSGRPDGTPSRRESSQRWALELEYALVLAGLGELRAATMHLAQLLEPAIRNDRSEEPAGAEEALVDPALRARAHLHLGDLLAAGDRADEADRAWSQARELAAAAIAEGRQSPRAAAIHVAALDRIGQQTAASEYREQLAMTHHRDPDLHASHSFLPQGSSQGEQP
ncbi:MAG: winged helix-turn-helix domain-containing protein [Xanthomonadaceae bacterium]|nr:winged helix-turn-helix domain-containing protein [Xanthomonadaceae bacterium]